MNNTDLKKMYGQVNYVTKLMELNKIEQALSIIYEIFPKLDIGPKRLLASNLLQARTQYDLRNVVMPEGFYSFIANELAKITFNKSLVF